MNAKQLVKIGQELYNKRGWRARMAAALEVDVTTIRRWEYRDEVPGPAAAALKCFMRERKNQPQPGLTRNQS